jgi:hypothetical protein
MEAPVGKNLVTQFPDFSFFGMTQDIPPFPQLILSPNI